MVSPDSPKILTAGGEPLTLSVACALGRVRLAIRSGPGSAQARNLLRNLRGAVKDTYMRRASQKGRDWPHKKKDKPPGLPRIQIASQEQLSQAKTAYVKIKAA